MQQHKLKGWGSVNDHYPEIHSTLHAEKDLETCSNPRLISDSEFSVGILMGVDMLAVLPFPFLCSGCSIHI